MIRTGAFPPGDEWAALLAALDASPRLHAHVPGALTKLSTYLHQRTVGMIGSLSRLVRSAAVRAVIDGTGRITRASLDSIEVDVAAESARPKAQARGQ